ncbi:hypothetical protein Scep_015759 [Stephania cephalantha]|uniref:C2H2-type domain-containing protein n=1 Tax=Stephania cephalantha TaxID=152367 RepID=A0AAP0J3T4_9MAGN
MKRSIGEMESNITSMANCLMLLSQRVNGGGGDHDSAIIRSTSAVAAAAAADSRVFECKTCNRQFASFQALGGHRASHKKPKLNESSTELQMTQFMNQRQAKPKTHECSICGLEFSIGQALGGHMRRHRANNNNGSAAAATTTTITTSTTTDNSSSTSSINVMPSRPIIQQVPVLKRSSSRRVLCLDLNLSPPENYDFEVPLGSSSVGFVEKNVAPAPMIHCFI